MEMRQSEPSGDRQMPEVDPARKALVTQWLTKVRAAEKYWEKDFKAMRRDMDLARLGADGDWVGADNYVANLIQRHVNQKVAALYARNPRARAKRRERLEFAVWDGDPQSAMAAQQAVAAQAQATRAGDPMAPLLADPQSQAILQDIAEAQARIRMLDRMGKTLEILFHYYLDEQEPRFKKLAKMMVRRAIVTGIAYLKLGFQRILEPQPDISARINDVTEQISVAERMMADAADGVDVDPDSPNVEELRLLLADLQSKESIVVREGPVTLFPESTAIIPDPKCKQLDGFIGADWVAEKFIKTPDEVKEIYKVDLGKNYREHTADTLTKFEKFYESDEPSAKDAHKGLCVVYEIHHKKNRQVLTVAEGYPDFLREPAAPRPMLERFWPYLTLTFNDIAHECELFPNSDVRMLYPMQQEYNRSRQGLREQRQANRPKYVTAASAGLDQSDKDQLKSHPNSALLEIKALQPNQKVGDLIQRFPTVPIDPALYDTTPIFEDVLRTVGSQEANFGPNSGGTATESSIAESSRMSVQSSDVDSLDDLLTDYARSQSQMMLSELPKESVVEIVGPGAVWPEVSPEQNAKEIWLEVKAGSSGRPNRAAELANLERAAPTVLQVPGISPVWFARQVLERLDDSIDVSEAIVEGLPSIVAMNQMARSAAGGAAQMATGDPATDPAQQGGAGGKVADDQANRNEPGGQPAFPA